MVRDAHAEHPIGIGFGLAEGVAETIVPVIGGLAGGSLPEVDGAEVIHEGSRSLRALFSKLPESAGA